MESTRRARFTDGTGGHASAPRWLARLRAVALAAVLAGGAGSVGLTLYAGRHTAAPILLPLFALWVLSPFVMVLVLHAAAARWSVPTRVTLYSVMLFLAVVSLAIYAGVTAGASTPKTQVFVALPPVSWLFIAIAVPAAPRLAGRFARRMSAKGAARP